MTKAKETYEFPIVVCSSDIDRLGHVNNVSYVRWVQDAAVAHWQAAAPPAIQEKLVWVVVRHEIDYKRAAFLGEQLIARTWVGSASRLAFKRHTEIVRASDRAILASAVTTWCPIDSKSGKPIDPGDEVRARFSTERL